MKIKHYDFEIESTAGDDAIIVYQEDINADDGTAKIILSKRQMESFIKALREASRHE
jgi:hypothetical protein